MFGSNLVDTQRPVQVDSSAMVDVPNLLSFNQSQKASALLAIEEGLGHEIENDLEKRAKQLPNLEIDNLVNEYMQLSSVRKFLLRNKSKFSELDAATLNELLKKYFASQINFSQSVNLERDLLTVSQYIRQYFGLDQAIDLLEKIGDPSFDLEAYLSLNLHTQDVKQKAAMSVDDKAEQVESVLSNPIKFQEIQHIIHRIKNIYAHAEIKKLVYNDPALKQEVSYKNFQESLMWINGQRLTCVTGLKNIREKKVALSPLAHIENIAATPLQGARALLQNTIGMFVDDELQNFSHQLANKPVTEIVNHIKNKQTYGQFLAALNNATHAGFSTFLPHATLADLIRLTEEYLYISVHLAQSIKHEQNLIKISQNIRQEFDIETSQKLLMYIEKPNFDFDKFFRGPKKPSAEIKTLIESIHHFYVYAAIKKQDNFFDADEEQAQKLFESEMWLNLQRRCCIQGMSLIKSGEVYLGKQIDFVNLNVALEAAEEKSQVQDNTNTSKKARLERLSSTIVLPPSQPAVVNWASWQSVNENEALAIAIAESQLEAQREQKEIVEAINRSLLSISQPMAVLLPPRPVVEKRDGNNRTELMNAAATGDLDGVKRLVESGAGNINSIGPHGNKPIHFAATNGREAVVAYLISKGASPTDTNLNFRTAQQLLDLGNKFTAAAACGDIPELARLIQAFKLSPDIRNAQNRSALMVAAANGQLATVKYLLETAHANIDAIGPNGNKAIHCSAQNDREDVLAYLIAQGASPLELNGNLRSAHQLASISNKFINVIANTRLTEDEVIGELERLKNHFKISADCRNDQNKTALMMAAQMGRLSVVKYLIEACEVNLDAVGVYGNKAIHCAAQNNQDDVVAYLISKNASPIETNLNSRTAHDLMSLNNRFVSILTNTQLTEEEMIQQLAYLQSTFKISADCRSDQNKTALMMAAQNGHLKVVKYLLEVCLVNINAVGIYGNKAIHCAAQNDQQEVMAYLIGLGASPTETNSNHKTAHDLADLTLKFFAAIRRGEIDTLRKMITALKVNPASMRDQYNKTALIAAVIANKKPLIEFLIEECHVPVDSVDANQKDAMHYAATENHQDVVDYLAEQGAQRLPQPVESSHNIVEPNSASPSNADIEPINIPVSATILADAHKLLAGLQNIAQLTENEIDDASAPYWGTSDENDNKYERTHKAEFSLQAAGIGQQRFYAASELLDNALGRIRAQEGNDVLELGLNQGMDRIQITAQYSVRLRQLRYSSEENQFKSPIAQFPFDKIGAAMVKILNASFTNWQPASSHDNNVMKTFSNSEEMYQTLSGIFAIEKACGEIEQDFKLNINMSEGRRNHDTHVIFVNKAKLERAKQMCGYTAAVHYGQSPSLASLLVANHSVLQSERRESAELLAEHTIYGGRHAAP